MVVHQFFVSHLFDCIHLTCCEVGMSMIVDRSLEILDKLTFLEVSFWYFKITVKSE